MKTKMYIWISVALLSAACSSSYYARSQNDDLYYVPSKGGYNTNQQVATKSAPVTNSDAKTDYERYREALDKGELNDTTGNQATQYYNDDTVANLADSKEPMVESKSYYEDGNEQYLANSYYLDNDYYFGYGPRLHFFHGYYSPWYNPGWRFSLGWGYDPFCYDYYNPWYSWYSPYYYGYGYYNPYWSGYYRGYYDSYYYDRYYGYYNHGYYNHGNYSPRSYHTRTLAGVDASSRRVYTSGANTSTRSSVIRNGNYNASTSSRTGVRSYENQSSRTVYTRRAYSQNDNGRKASEGTSSSRTYTPSYSVSRSDRRPAYNERASSSTQTTRPYAAPRRSSEYSSSRSSSSSSPSSSSRSSSYEGSRSYSSPSSSSSSSSYSRGSSSSYSSGSSGRSSGGSSYSGGSSGGSSRSSGGSSSSHSSGGRR